MWPHRRKNLQKLSSVGLYVKYLPFWNLKPILYILRIVQNKPKRKWAS